MKPVTHTDSDTFKNPKDISVSERVGGGWFLAGLCGGSRSVVSKNGDYQDSKKVLIENLGARRGEAPGLANPPQVKLLSPQEGESVGKETIAVQSSADRGIDHHAQRQSGRWRKSAWQSSGRRASSAAVRRAGSLVFRRFLS